MLATSQVRRMAGLFEGDLAFNQDLSGWDVGSVGCVAEERKIFSACHLDMLDNNGHDRIQLGEVYFYDADGAPIALSHAFTTNTIHGDNVQYLIDGIIDQPGGPGARKWYAGECSPGITNNAANIHPDGCLLEITFSAPSSVGSYEFITAEDLHIRDPTAWTLSCAVSSAPPPPPPSAGICAAVPSSMDEAVEVPTSTCGGCSSNTRYWHSGTDGRHFSWQKFLDTGNETAEYRCADRWTSGWQRWDCSAADEPPVDDATWWIFDPDSSGCYHALRNCTLCAVTSGIPPPLPPATPPPPSTWLRLDSRTGVTPPSARRTGYGNFTIDPPCVDWPSGEDPRMVVPPPSPPPPPLPCDCPGLFPLLSSSYNGSTVGQPSGSYTSNAACQTHGRVGLGWKASRLVTLCADARFPVCSAQPRAGSRIPARTRITSSARRSQPRTR